MCAPCRILLIFRGVSGSWLSSLVQGSVWLGSRFGALLALRRLHGRLLMRCSAMRASVSCTLEKFSSAAGTMAAVHLRAVARLLRAALERAQQTMSEEKMEERELAKHGVTAGGAAAVPEGPGTTSSAHVPELLRHAGD
jgi:hypothetical protein